MTHSRYVLCIHYLPDADVLVDTVDEVLSDMGLVAWHNMATCQFYLSESEWKTVTQLRNYSTPYRGKKIVSLTAMRVWLTGIKPASIREVHAADLQTRTNIGIAI